jgi:hypothetical protein
VKGIDAMNLIGALYGLGDKVRAVQKKYPKDKILYSCMASVENETVPSALVLTNKRLVYARGGLTSSIVGTISLIGGIIFLVLAVVMLFVNPAISFVFFGLALSGITGKVIMKWVSSSEIRPIELRKIKGVKYEPLKTAFGYTACTLKVGGYAFRMYKTDGLALAAKIKELLK